ncbi:hypothetical protein CDL15_Pgr000275 [Punica granatum]|uniref:B box-type domain-containing protein n=1 Tax=Punica granatum TaxID=22663 RepID=A0A218Y3D3_PUNGR|nr:hypothetical protein CDL15_Pgr000275 [Punica granatum]PKI71400.1 hypothetical protein CRG98_008209 [Punica granatum]
MKQCELCKSPANIYCDPDRANLCWDCDKKVHGANFLVAKHTRTLLCHACQSPSPWRSSGLNLTPVVSVCGDCVKGRDRAESRIELGGDDIGGGTVYECDNNSDDGDDVDEHGEEDYGGEEEEEENQVVPGGLSSPPHPISTSSSSTDEESSSRSSSCRETANSMISRNRLRENNKL